MASAAVRIIQWQPESNQIVSITVRVIHIKSQNHIPFNIISHNRSKANRKGRLNSQFNPTDMPTTMSQTQALLLQQLPSSKSGPKLQPHTSHDRNLLALIVFQPQFDQIPSYQHSTRTSRLRNTASVRTRHTATDIQPTPFRGSQYPSRAPPCAPSAATVMSDEDNASTETDDSDRDSTEEPTSLCSDDTPATSFRSDSPQNLLLLLQPPQQSSLNTIYVPLQRSKSEPLPRPNLHFCINSPTESNPIHSHPQTSEHDPASPASLDMPNPPPPAPDPPIRVIKNSIDMFRDHDNLDIEALNREDAQSQPAALRESDTSYSTAVEGRPYHWRQDWVACADVDGGNTAAEPTHARGRRGDFSQRVRLRVRRLGKGCRSWRRGG